MQSHQGARGGRGGRGRGGGRGGGQRGRPNNKPYARPPGSGPYNKHKKPRQLPAAAKPPTHLFSSKCIECESATSKYRCVKCKGTVCSLICNNKHLQHPCVDPSTHLQPADEPEMAVDFVPKPMHSFLNVHYSNSLASHKLPTHVAIENEIKARIPLSRLKRLVHSDAILDALGSSTLRYFLTQIDNTSTTDTRDRALTFALTRPDFAKFADTCLEIVGRTDTPPSFVPPLSTNVPCGFDTTGFTTETVTSAGPSTASTPPVLIEDGEEEGEIIIVGE